MWHTKSLVKCIGQQAWCQNQLQLGGQQSLERAAQARQEQRVWSSPLKMSKVAVDPSLIS